MAYNKTPKEIGLNIIVSVNNPVTRVDYGSCIGNVYRRIRFLYSIYSFPL